LPVAANFKYGYAQQGNLTIERALSNSWKVSVGYQYTRGIHLNRPVDINSTDPQLLSQNALNAAVSGLNVSNPVTVVVPSGPVNTCVNQGSGSIFLIAPGALGRQAPIRHLPQQHRADTAHRWPWPMLLDTLQDLAFRCPSTVWTLNSPMPVRGITR
jgi:hypothetical protein